MSQSLTIVYDTNLFVDRALAENFICSICRNVLHDPVQLPCGHAFCRTCITQSLENRSICPLDRKHYRLHQILPFLVIAKNVYNGLRLRCSFGGCHQVLDLVVYDNHRTNCDHNPDKPVKCHRCLADMTAKDKSSHDCVTYLQKKVSELEACDRDAGEKMVKVVERVEIIGAQVVVNEKDISKLQEHSKSQRDSNEALRSEVKELKENLESMEAKWQRMEKSMKMDIKSICEENISKLRQERSQSSSKLHFGDGKKSSRSGSNQAFSFQPKSPEFCFSSSDIDNLFNNIELKNSDSSF